MTNGNGKQNKIKEKKEHNNNNNNNNNNNKQKLAEVLCEIPPTLYIDDTTLIQEISDLTLLRKGDHVIVGLNVLRTVIPFIDYLLSFLTSLHLWRIYHHSLVLDDVAYLDGDRIPRTSSGNLACILEYTNTVQGFISDVKKDSLLSKLNRNKYSEIKEKFNNENEQKTEIEIEIEKIMNNTKMYFEKNEIKRKKINLLENNLFKNNNNNNNKECQSLNNQKYYQNSEEYYTKFSYAIHKGSNVKDRIESFHRKEKVFIKRLMSLFDIHLTSSIFRCLLDKAHCMVTPLYEYNDTPHIFRVVKRVSEEERNVTVNRAIEILENQPKYNAFFCNCEHTTNLLGGGYAISPQVPYLFGNMFRYSLHICGVTGMLLGYRGIYHLFSILPVILQIGVHTVRSLMGIHGNFRDELISTSSHRAIIAQQLLRCMWTLMGCVYGYTRLPEILCGKFSSISDLIGLYWIFCCICGCMVYYVIDAVFCSIWIISTKTAKMLLCRVDLSIWLSIRN